ncbi:uncharacterized protein N7484_006377 [Penicillium longicatenatum]|uniref:uncharacterized protein n=1 Tax=Penicillium longicatenatum TaxID=1561947 RepID=UPI00254846F1|nr:uncharacterized protein N7484_006377 [Penicillium longicatenatum]KAJ5643870.1 hypothetical protein N7484_006377 [Penicillium longicatenatum]
MSTLESSGSRNSIHNPIPSSLSSECAKAAVIIDSFINPKFIGDGGIPRKILLRAKALIICTVLRVGFLGCGRFGSGVVVIRLPDGNWSAPSAIGLGGVGMGGLIGAELTDFVFVLYTDEAVTKFMQSGFLHLGLNVSVAFGVGRSAESGGIVGSKGVSGFYSFSKTRGLYGGVSAELGVIVERSRANKKIYERKIKSVHLAGGEIPSPREAESLIHILNSMMPRPSKKPVADPVVDPVVNPIVNPDSSGLQSLGREVPPELEMGDLSNLGPGLSDIGSSEAHWSGLSAQGSTHKPRELNKVPRELLGKPIQPVESAEPTQPTEPAEPSKVFELESRHGSTLPPSENLSHHASVNSSTENSSQHTSLQSSVVNPLETRETRDSSVVASPGVIPENPSKEAQAEHATDQDATVKA